ncbi:MAG: phosphatase PAP2 family protein [Zymomonas mobilis]|uniref:Phosphoesterase PA-phosphatase related protein n=1 Tax=Zymomonas mobilis subsp. mobilis (strain ATCC 10988 / DSM 424 / LMG 404 / NCIMB 8938 / NRRL B-806 / ZM1) TaxID=555217 RepID=A0A0H3FYX2_ZYMMA|nr:phosphatase PAP2 family protein [Zymomonas mobilis]ACV75289.1 phosphoesterase PA-phosphatase related [Zymomonas mobilis subsp. mobilis NCIMB 11163]AEH62872.1 phosphoesterase PA-phosphatase related protein [Zymomonas mobilis subsp. mobilis ATCC 10988]AHB10075.1 membrane-associated phospholipid phosphatase [Zymomonas mobilis subsp. mobilis str. CP4 = NRRL B-14023]AHJ70381.1 PAP2 superfamily protein [Zymomonas mobilis subsp. mobilis NRRL B-12526]AHJ72236.1 PAP2 superfamily protein [Zymomonas m
MPFFLSGWRWVAIVFFCIIAFLIGFLTACEAPGAFDLTLLHLIGGFASRHHWVACIARIGSFAGNVSVRVSCILVAVITMVALKDKLGAIFAILAPLGGWAFFSLLKLVINRPRPLIFFHLDHVDGASFPSGHSTNAMIVYPMLALLIRRHGGRLGWLYASIVLAVFVGLSRVALAVHWPSDVMAGWVAGSAWLLVCYEICEQWGLRHSDPLSVKMRDEEDEDVNAHLKHHESMS